MSEAINNHAAFGLALGQLVKIQWLWGLATFKNPLGRASSIPSLQMQMASAALQRRRSSQGRRRRYQSGVCCSCSLTRSCCGLRWQAGGHPAVAALQFRRPGACCLPAPRMFLTAYIMSAAHGFTAMAPRLIVIRQDRGLVKPITGAARPGIAAVMRKSVAQPSAVQQPFECKLPVRLWPSAHGGAKP